MSELVIVPRPVNALRFYENNPRRNDEVVSKMVDQIREFGFVVPMLIQPDGEVIDGHLRLKAARVMGMTEVPCIVASDWSPAQIKAFRISVNKSSEWATWDFDLLGEEIKSIMRMDFNPEKTGFETDEIGQMLSSSAFDAKILDPFAGGIGDGLPDSPDPNDEDELGAPPPDNPVDIDGPITRAVPDTIFPTDNEWGVPVLDLKLQVEQIELPVSLWGSQSRKRRMNGTWLFYVDDYRFSALWTNPNPVIETRCVACAEMNISVNAQMPPAVVLWKTYQKRWIAKYWQTYGLRIIVDVYGSPRHHDVNMIGVPKGWRSYMIRGQQGCEEELLWYRDKLREHAGTEDIRFFVYEGGKKIETFCHENGLLFISDIGGDYGKLKERSAAFAGRTNDSGMMPVVDPDKIIKEQKDAQAQEAQELKSEVMAQ